MAFWTATTRASYLILSRSSVNFRVLKKQTFILHRFRTIATKPAPVENMKHVKESQAFIKRRFDDVIASPEDKRSYRGLELANDLKVLLISDPLTDKSAASLAVAVGHLNDPVELPGLAHFCEHMLFLGTEKYPSENEYQKYLSMHGGSCNAYTSTDETNYHFDVAPEFMEGALDRFSQFFVGPLFTETCTEREVLAVDSEFCNYVQQDNWRLCQLERSLSNPAHPYSKFSVGNKITLFEDAKLKNLEARRELLRFHEQNYSSNIMAVTVLGKESLDDLQNMVVPLFASIPNKNLSKPYWDEHPYGADQVGYRVNVVPVKDLKSMHVSFPIPDLNPHYKSNPGHYVSHLLGHEGEGSLLSELKRKGWVNNLSAGPSTSARGFGFFKVDMELSEEGLDHTDEILLLLFQYINLLRTKGPQEWIHREVESLSEMHFRFQDKPRPQPYVTMLSTAMHYYPINEVLYAPYMMPDYKPELLKYVVDMLNVGNFGYAVVSQKFKGSTKLTEKWYGTEYNKERIEPNLLEKCAHVDKWNKDCVFNLPAPNSFIPKNFDLYPLDSAEKGKPPSLLHDDPSVRIWFKQDDEFMLPKCCVFINMRSPVVYQTPHNHALCTLLADLVRDALTEYSYDASLAGLHYSLTNGRHGFALNISGYNEKQKVLVEKLVEKFATFKPDPARFEILKERFVRALKNFAQEQPYQHAVYNANLLLAERGWTNEECLREAECLTLEQLVDFMPTYFEALHIQAYVHGNTNKQEAEELVESVRHTLNKFSPTKPLYSSQLMQDRAVCLPENSSFLFETTNTTHSNSALEVYFQTRLENPRLNMLNELLGQIVSEPCYSQLRTKEQLGYIVFSGVQRLNGAQGMRFIVQGGKSPEYMDARLEAFLKDVQRDIEKMTDAEFEQHKSSLATIRLEKPKKLSSKAYKNWTEICKEQYHFDRDNKEVEVLKTFTKEDLLQFYKEFISSDAPKRKKLGVHILSKDAKAGGDIKIPWADDKPTDGAKVPDATKIQDIASFKAHLPLYEIPKPYMDVPLAGLPNPK